MNKYLFYAKIFPDPKNMLLYKIISPLNASVACDRHTFITRVDIDKYNYIYVSTKLKMYDYIICLFNIVIIICSSFECSKSEINTNIFIL